MFGAEEQLDATAKSAAYAESPALPPGALRWSQAMALLGLIVLAGSLVNWESPDFLKYGAFLTIAILSSGVPIDVPGVAGSFSLIFLFVLFGTLELTRSETVDTVATLMALAQCYGQRPGTRTPPSLPRRLQCQDLDTATQCLGSMLGRGVVRADVGRCRAGGRQ